MKLFSTDIMICATAYIKAESEEEALKIAQAELKDRGIEFSNRYQGLDDNLCIDGRPYECLLDNDEEVALSPAMTIHGPWHSTTVVGGTHTLDEVEVEEEDQ